MREIDLEKTGPATYGPPAQSPIRRMICLAIAVTLLVVCAVLFGYTLMYGSPERRGFSTTLVALAFVGSTAAYWLWEDFIKATPND